MATTQIIYGGLSGQSISATTLYVNSNQTINNGQLIINQSNDIVGLDVVNSSEAMVQVQNTPTQYSIFGRFSGETYVYSTSAIPIVFYTNGLNKRMTIDSNGNVGIGISSPLTKLQVSGNTLINGTLSATTISATTYLNFPTTVTANTSTIHFTGNTVFGSYSSPLSSNITDDLTNSKLGITQKIYHNSGSAPTVPAGWVLLGSTTYQISTVNIIYAEWSEGTRVEYWIVR